MARQLALRTPAAPGLPSRPRRLQARLSDERLAKLVAREGEAPFVEIYERYHQALYRYCRSILRNESDAQDALQSAMAGAYAALRTRERDVALRPWLFRIAHNESVSLLRRRHPEEMSADEQALATPSAALQPDQALEQREQLATLITDLGTLSVRQRGALLMRELSGLSIEEIALALGISEGAGKQALFEARAALRAQEEGRSMECEEIRRLLWQEDKRQLRGRRLRSHLRSCAACQEVQETISARSKSLRALAPPLPAVLAASMLQRLLGHAGGGSLAAATGAASGGGSAASIGGAGSAGGTATAAGASAAGASSGAAGLAAHLGGALALKVGAAIVILAAAAGAARITLYEHAGEHHHHSHAALRPAQGTKPTSGPRSRADSAQSTAGGSASSRSDTKSVGATKSPAGSPGKAGSVSNGAFARQNMGVAPTTSSSASTRGEGAQGLALGHSKQASGGQSEAKVKHQSTAQTEHGHATRPKHLHVKTKAEKTHSAHGHSGTHSQSQSTPSTRRESSSAAGKANGRSAEHEHPANENSSEAHGQSSSEHGAPASSSRESGSPNKDNAEGHGREEHAPSAQSEGQPVTEPSVESPSTEPTRVSPGEANGH